MDISIYKPWQINPSQYPERANLEAQMKFMLGYAILAPSTFNSQPWLCQLKKDAALIYIDIHKMPQKSDKQGRFGFISVGCFLENFLVATKAFGWETDVKLNQQVGAGSHLIAMITFKQRNKDIINLDQLSNLSKRATNRSLSQEYRLTDSQQEEMQKMIVNGIDLSVLDAALYSEIIALSQEADMRIWSDIEFRKEHVEWVRSNITRKPDGMPGFGVGVGLIPSLLSRPVILSAKFATMQASKNKRALSSSSSYAVLSSSDSAQDWIAIGQSFQRLNLYLLTQGLAAAPMGQFIEDNKARLELQSIIKTEHPPQLFMRINKPTQPVRHSPRRRVEDIIIQSSIM